jgi:hypothetical protein
MKGEVSVMQRQRLFRIGLSLIVNVLLSWILLPLVIPPFGKYSLSNLFEVLLWQGIGMVGWPFALIGILLSLVSGSSISDSASLTFLLLYPIIQFLLIHIVISKPSRHIELILLHVCIMLSFIAVWYPVRNGYDFMVG